MKKEITLARPLAEFVTNDFLQYIIFLNYVFMYVYMYENLCIFICVCIMYIESCKTKRLILIIGRKHNVLREWLHH